MKSIEKLLNVQKQNNSILCVGLDSDINKLPSHFNKEINSLLDFNIKIIEVTKDLSCAYKLNFAFYEQYGMEGFDILKQTIKAIPEDIFIIADAKRGDIGNTSAAYAKSCFDYFKADSITVNPYMGFDSVKPFLDFKDKLVFLLALTSNPGSGDFQRLNSEGKPVFRHVIDKSMTWAEKNNLGYVIGATHPQELEEIRDIASDRLFLIPGVGTQGGDIEGVLKANKNGPAVINVSRAVIYASSGTDFAEKARETAEFYRDSFNI